MLTATQLALTEDQMGAHHLTSVVVNASKDSFIVIVRKASIVVQGVHLDENPAGQPAQAMWYVEI